MTRVALVLDPDFGAKLEKIAARVPVWVPETAGNLPAIVEAWKSAKLKVTGFVVDERETREQWCRSVLGDVDEHHGPLSCVPPYSELEIIGIELSPTLRALFEGYSFIHFDETDGGFVARK
jgi:hypothetical protein